MPDKPDRGELIAQWLRGLDSPRAGRDIEPLLARLLDMFGAGLDAEPFDIGAGTRIGHALADAGLLDPAVPVVSAPVLFRVATGSAPVTTVRAATLLAAVGGGFEQRRHQYVEPHLDGDRRDADRFRGVFDNTPIAIGIADTNGVVVDANRSLAEMIGIPVEQLYGTSLHHLSHPDDRDTIRSLVFGTLVPARQGTVKIEARAVGADGLTRWSAFTVTYVRGEDGREDYLLSVGEDVTERHLLEEELHRQARRDPLTGLSNRRHLLEMMNELVAGDGGGMVGLCFADLDRFKQINDRFGHRVGDEVLRAVADRFRTALTIPAGENCTLARLGGDEFVILVPAPVDETRTAAVSDELQAALSAPLTVGGHRISVSVSVGTVVASLADMTADDLLDAADLQLYSAKTTGRPAARGTSPSPPRR